MACGVPLLAYAIPGISELVRDGVEAKLVPPGDTTAWAEALAELLGKDDLRSSLATRSRKRVENHYSTEKILPLHTALACAVSTGKYIILSKSLGGSLILRCILPTGIFQPENHGWPVGFGPLKVVSFPIYGHGSTVYPF